MSDPYAIQIRASLQRQRERETAVRRAGLRDFIAAQAMAAIISKHTAQDLDKGIESETVSLEVARGAYEYADAMLEVRDASDY